MVYPYVCRLSVYVSSSILASHAGSLQADPPFQINNYKQTTNSTVCVDNSLQYSCNSAAAVTQVHLESILSIKRANWEVQHLKVDCAFNLLFIPARFDDVTWLRTQVKQISRSVCSLSRHTLGSLSQHTNTNHLLVFDEACLKLTEPQHTNNIPVSRMVC